MGQSEPDKVTIAAAKPADTSSATPSEKKTSWGNVKLGGAIPDLNRMLDDKKTEAESVEPELRGGEQREPFTYDELLKHWHAFADQLKTDNKINLFTLMTANAPKLLPDDQIEVIVENAIQEELLQTSKIDILNQLRVQLRNFSIDLVPVRLKSDAARKPYTAQEKYQAMAAKNPALDVLRQTFNLGLE